MFLKMQETAITVAAGGWLRDLTLVADDKFVVAVNTLTHGFPHL